MTAVLLFRLDKQASYEVFEVDSKPGEDKEVKCVIQREGHADFECTWKVDASKDLQKWAAKTVKFMNGEEEKKNFIYELLLKQPEDKRIDFAFLSPQKHGTCTLEQLLLEQPEDKRIDFAFPSPQKHGNCTFKH